MTDTDEIVQRRFGPGFESKCERPSIIECANWKCQVANRCRYPSADPMTKRPESYLKLLE